MHANLAQYALGAELPGRQSRSAPSYIGSLFYSSKIAIIFSNSFSISRSFSCFSFFVGLGAFFAILALSVFCVLMLLTYTTVAYIAIGMNTYKCPRA